MKYVEMNDNELVYLSNSSNEEATELLIKKYKNVILTILKEYQKKYKIYGIEIADLYQEGLIGLLTAIETFNKNRDILFYTYANVCIRTAIMTEVRRTFRNKNRILNNSYSLDFLYDDTKATLYEMIKDEESDPGNIIINEENQNELVNNIKNLLSKSELIVFELKLKGLSNNEICSLLDKDKKYVENTLFRINRKYKDYKERL